ncbi:MAG TPA: hypothetical protein VGC47_07135 [Acidimicrobiia bacterium]
MILASYLRVYVPRDRVATLPKHASRGNVRVVRGSDHFVWQEPTTHDAFEIDFGGSAYVCPRFPLLRMLEGALAFNSTYPGAMIVPEQTFHAVAEQLSELRTEHPAARSHILTSPWHVPLRWFSAFTADERELYTTPSGPSIRYRASLTAAVDRVARAVGIVDEAGFDDSVVGQIRSLERWLRDFSPDGVLELDYATVAALFEETELVLDESGADVIASLDALERFDYDEAGIHYAAVASRWAPLQAVTYSN